jgi:nitroimidazol reductase NimA-like FMN-containing flavoprotein (pyridoxamine 5'-phosphate oxidase superfamily)
MSNPPSERARVKRYNHIADYDPATIHAILDAMPLCHVGYIFNGTPFVTPTLQWRDGDNVFWHGSAASRALETAECQQVCLTVSLFDGLVMARSAYNYNINHRSVMIFGTPERLSDEDKAVQLRNMVNRTIPGQWERLRPVLPKELKATTVLGMKITEASAKLRSGQPDDDEDAEFPVWTGVIPVRYEVGEPVANPKNLPGVEFPEEGYRFKIG